MRRAIATRWLGPAFGVDETIMAESDHQVATLRYDREQTADHNHFLVAMALAVKLGWVGGEWDHGTWCGGRSNHGDGRVWVWVEGDES